MIQHSNELDDDDRVISKSQIKREAEALQEMGRSIYALPKRVRRKLPLEPQLAAAFEEADRLKNPDALRRHFRYIGRLLRELDNGHIKAELAKIKTTAQTNQLAQADLNATIETLLRNDRGASESLLETFPLLDRQRLNQLIRNAISAEASLTDGSPPSLARQRLRKYLSTSMRNTRPPAG
ncbi:MAG: DUF615 domain-containing protein [Gammaproteobacteria bacterium]|nr:DUF615 domain-containing protein [Gammaproteobacteria bacterium]